MVTNLKLFIDYVIDVISPFVMLIVSQEEPLVKYCVLVIPVCPLVWNPDAVIALTTFKLPLIYTALVIGLS